ncbi:uncharacterized protein [Euphorbia lathyris]|uniref:uncharacterized protein n=1 Tax=Euphorbia lathyris TaxID=212925 RepID=UPI0033132DD5
MGSYLAFFILFSLLLTSNIIGARKDMGEYWKAIKEYESIPQTVALKPNCHTSESLDLKKLKNFDKTESPDLTIYVNDNLNGGAFVKEFEENPDLTVITSKISNIGFLYGDL